MKRLLTILTLLIFALPTVTFASDRLEVNFQNSPLFKEANFVPGDINTRTFSVKNTSGEEQTVGLNTINTYTGGLEEVLEVKIFAGETIYFSGTLRKLYQQDFVDLGKLGDGAKKTYSMSIAFRASAGDEYQNADTGFDLCVGFVGDGENCVTDNQGPAGPVPGDNGNEGQGGGRGGRGTQFMPSSGGSDMQTPTGEPSVVPSVTGGDIPTTPAAAAGGVGTATTGTVGDVGAMSDTEDDLSQADNDEANREASTTNQAAAAFLGLPDNLADGIKCLAALVVILILIWLLTLAYDAVRRAREMPVAPRVKGRIAFISSLLAASTLVTVLVPFPCIILILYILSWVSVGWFVFESRRLRSR